MNAIEFVQKHGLKAAQQVIEDWGRFTHVEKPTHFDADLNIFIHEKDLQTLDESDVPVDGILRVVKAFEITGLFKDVIHALTECDACDGDEHSQIIVKIGDGVGYVDVLRVRQAIDLVEQCNAKP